MTWSIAILLALAQAPPAQNVDEAQAPKLVAGFGDVRAGHAQAALDAAEDVLKAYDADHACEKRQIFCGMSMVEAIAYMGLTVRGGPGSIAVGPGYCTALFLKGYALVDLNRIAEARTVYQRLVGLAPMHAHYLAELGQTYRYEQNWPKMLETCSSAEGFAELSNPDEVNTAKGMAWRCMGYALTEQHKYKEAAALYRKCLKLDANDSRAAHELQYIEEQQRK
jgi:tetratricopeptide (TPR) repeat protein